MHYSRKEAVSTTESELSILFGEGVLLLEISSRSKQPNVEQAIELSSDEVGFLIDRLVDAKSAMRAVAAEEE